MICVYFRILIQEVIRWEGLCIKNGCDIISFFLIVTLWIQQLKKQCKFGKALYMNPVFPKFVPHMLAHFSLILLLAVQETKLYLKPFSPPTSPLIPLHSLKTFCFLIFSSSMKVLFAYFTNGPVLNLSPTKKWPNPLFWTIYINQNFPHYKSSHIKMKMTHHAPEELNLLEYETSLRKTKETYGESFTGCTWLEIIDTFPLPVSRHGMTMGFYCKILLDFVIQNIAPNAINAIYVCENG